MPKYYHWPRIPMIYLPEDLWTRLQDQGDFHAEVEVNPVSLGCVGGTLTPGQRCAFTLDNVSTPLIGVIQECDLADPADEGPWNWSWNVRVEQSPYQP